jgi:hypothetical protein
LSHGDAFGKDQSLKLSGKILRIGGVENLSFFESAVLIFFASSHENQPTFIG